MRVPVRIAVFVGCLSAAAILTAQQNDVFTTLGLSPEDAHENFMASLTSGAFALRGRATPFKEAGAEARALMVRAVVAAARTYLGTADFAKRYNEYRESRRPEREDMPASGDEAMAAQMKAMQQAIDEAQKMATQLPPESRKQLAENIAEMKKQMAALNADPEHRKMLDTAMKEAAKMAETDYARRMAEFEEEVPADPNKMIAKRLRDFLATSATVDFNAKLFEKDKRMRFVDPALEAKPRDWKLLYRAGKPAVDAARAAAQDWLKALPQ